MSTVDSTEQEEWRFVSFPCFFFFYPHNEKDSVTFPPTDTSFWPVPGSAHDQPKEYLHGGLSETRISHVSASSYANFGFVFRLFFIFNMLLLLIAMFSLQLVSPDDLVNAAKMFSSVNMPLK